MGFFDKIADKATAKKLEEVKLLLLENEEVEYAFSLLLDHGYITNKRLIISDKSFLSSEQALISIPFSKINSVSILKKGGFSTLKKLEIMVGSHSFAFTITEEDPIEVYKMILNKIV